MAWAVQQQADIIVRMHPATFPLETEAAEPCNVLRWLRQRGHSEGEWQGWCRWQQQRYRVRLNHIRSKHRTSVEATVRALLLAWALPESTTTWLRTLLSAAASPALAVVSSWWVSGLGLETLRQQVQGRWSEARLQACLPRLRRLLGSRPRRRGHQECTVRAWLEQRARTRPDQRQKAA